LCLYSTTPDLSIIVSRIANSVIVVERPGLCVN
jgi:hypothetical protein